MNKVMGFVALLILISCQGTIKNTEAIVEEEVGTEIVDTTDIHSNEERSLTETSKAPEYGKDFPLGFWVGDFEQDHNKSEDRNYLYVDEGYMWNRTNKINISIDKIDGNKVIGHSVVAGNDRPFQGTVTKSTDSLTSSVVYSFNVREPGDDRYDGEFKFQIVGDQLIGKWEAYKNIEIKKRKYTLERKVFTYEPSINLEKAKVYVNWEKTANERKEIIEDGDDTYEWFSAEYATATQKIYEVNASTQILVKEDVENLMRGDLTIIRNTIYARHGYSFKNRPLRVFFDAQSWYIPVHTNIKADFTEIELSNIKLLLLYEKNAAEYYDSFGRG